MLSLEEIQRPVQEHLNRFNDYLIESVKDEKIYINDILDYILKNRGKQMRPLLVFLTSGLHGAVTRKTHVSALLIEMIHTASLVHDDVVDEAFQRRGKFSVHALWRSRKAVLIGDYIFSRGLRIAVQENVYEILGLISKAMEAMSRGELIQSEVAHKFNTSEEEYFEIIHGKTATLISSCSLAGAIAAQADNVQRNTMQRFGELLGLAFQIKDDILDYTTSDASGKIACNDLKEQKMTLPLIHVLSKASEKERKEVLQRFRNAEKEAGKNIVWLRDCVLGNGGTEYATEKMFDIRDQAVNLLGEYPDSSYKASLIDYAEYILSREK